MSDNNRKSYELFEEAKTVMPGGVQRSRHPLNFTGDYPVFMHRGKGSHVWDADGNEYVDWLLSYGPIILGHQSSVADEAVINEMNKGFLLDLTQELQVELARKLCGLIPSAEKALFVNTGSGATSAAVRLARIHTGRDVIIRWGYHGWHDWCCPDPEAGIPRSTRDLVKTFQYNNLDSLARVLEENKNKVACVIMMPFEIELPDPGFLEGVRELTNQHKTVLIFDEVRSWPRMGLGGAQSYFKVIPDMTTLSKGIANGYPISAVVGKSEIMECVTKTTVSATYFPSTIGIAAALATLGEIEKKNTIEHLWKIGGLLCDGLKRIIEDKRVKAAVMGFPVMPFLIFGAEDDYKGVWYEKLYHEGTVGTEKDRLLLDRFYSGTVNRGIFFHPRHHWFSCHSHTEEDVRRTLKAAEESLDLALRET